MLWCLQVFQKGAPIARDFSEAILTLAENGRLKALEENWLTPSNKCSNNSASPETESLTLDKFWGLYVICAATSTICLGLALLKNYLRKHNHFVDEAHQLPQRDVIAESDDDNNNNNDLKKASRYGRVLHNGNLTTLNKSATFGGSAIQGVRRRNSPRLESVIISDEPGNPQRAQSASQSAVIEMM
jgi:ionotropic glutamate receptor